MGRRRISFVQARRSLQSSKTPENAAQRIDRKKSAEPFQQELSTAEIRFPIRCVFVFFVKGETSGRTNFMGEHIQVSTREYKGVNSQLTSMSFRSSRPTVVYKLDTRSTRTAVVFVSDPETISVSRTTLGQPLALASPEPIIVIGKGGISTTMQVCQRALRELTPKCFVSLSPCPYTWTR